MCLWIVIVNFRTADLVVDCLRSLSSQVGVLAGARVAVVDNDSGDGSADRITAAISRHQWSAWAEVIRAERNGGFAFGNNAGIRAALSSPNPPDYLWLLNPDTVVRTGALSALVDFMAANPGVGIAGSQLEDAEGGLDISAHRVPTPLSELDSGARLGVLSRVLHRHVVSPPGRTEAHACDWVSGASLMIRRQAVEQIGPMDEGFFLYFEEVDFCVRVRQAGWSVWCVPESRVMHLEGAATGISGAARRRPGYWYDSRRRFFVKHHGVAGLLAADALWAVGRLLFLSRRVLRLGAQRRSNDPKCFMFDLLWGDLRALASGSGALEREVRW